MAINSTSFTNTPQAGDDNYSWTEDLLLASSIITNNVITLNVMSNDLGGNAKALFSLDDGNGNTLSPDFDLLTGDVGADGVSAWEKTALGNWVRIVNGKIEFKLDDGSHDSTRTGSIDALAAGQPVNDQFVYAIRLANGTLSQARVTLQIIGSNDNATITGTATACVTEAGGVRNANVGVPSASGTLTVHDVDAGQSVFQTPASLNGTYGTFTFNTTSGAWNYALDNGRVATQALTAGQVVHDTLSVTSADGMATQVINVTVNGTNDAAVITGNTSGAAAETNAPVTITGALNATDVDNAAGFQAGSTVGANGTFSVDAAGAWRFTANSAFDSLNVGGKAEEEFTVKSVDGTEQKVKVTINGSNDAAVITGDTSGSAAESNTPVTITGTLSATDVDNAPGFQAGSTVGTNGTFSIDAAGTWRFTANSAFDSLNVGGKAEEEFTVKSVDGTEQKVKVTITGTNDAPVITAQDLVGAVTELTTPSGTATLSDSGSISFTDVDLIDTHLVSAAGTPVGTTLGTLSAVRDHDTTGTGTGGALTWTYTVADAAVQYLAKNETKVESFTITLNDQNGSIITRQIDVTITGTNDAPVLSFTAGADAGAVQEDTGLLVSGQFTSSDIDHLATATWSIDGTASGSYGSIAVDSSGKWTYTLANGSAGVASAVQSLKAGESHDETFTVKVSDGLGGEDTQTVTITVTGTNDAPVLSFTAGADAGAVQEDTGLSMQGQFTSSDIDHLATATWSIDGTATGSYGSIAVDSSGKWTYTLANGTDGVASAVQSLKAGESHDETFTVKVSDGLGGTATQTVTITVTGTNDAPVLSFAAGAGADAGAVQEDTTLSMQGQFTSSDIDHLATATWSIDGTATGSYGSIAVDSTGEWTYTLANGTDGVASAVQSLKAGESHDETFTVKVSDGLGGEDTQTVTVTVTGTNDAPVLSAAATPVIQTVNEDAGAPSGAVGTLVSSLVDLNPPSGGLDNVTDADNGAVTGIALTGTDSAHGTWWYSVNGGTSWATVGAVSDASGLLLKADANTRLYFQGSADFNGTVTNGVTFRAWDQTSGAAGTTANASVNGNATAFSTASDTAAIVVAAVNDAPVASGSATLLAINEDTAAPAGATVSSLFGGNFSDAADAVSGGSSANTFAGIAIGSYAVDASKGAWQYSTNGGGSWNVLGSATTTTAVTLNAADMLRFVPIASYNGSATAIVANLIESGQTITSGATLNLTGATGGTTHISSGTVALSE
ncbi:MAG: VCBS domain-containing protein, partial [Burkholderiales bacterium]|nr:VCBS domain-containing protein [Burkholderiales bacterium]